ncbi:MAG TPA: HNH endonuclease signature motif containing protein [Candidatus Krumholzibacteria bacterium]|nr:HNH endonuclease signature motif containing protein [Candidatus Krumholzibacteria bacterium]
MFESLRSLSDSQIVSGIKTARAKEHDGMLSSLGFLVETERRQLHLKQSFSSLFDYCTRELRYSESQAMRRITAARCVVRFPDVFRLLEDREVNLGTISRVAKILTPDNCDNVLARISGKSLREVEAIVAEFDPAAALPRDRVRTVVVRVPVTPSRSVGENHLRYGGKKPSSVGVSTSTCEHVKHGTVSAPAKPLAGAAVLERKAVVQFTASEAVMQKLERIRSLASHRLPANASLEQLIDFMADYVIQREDPALREARRKARAAQPVEPTRRAAVTPAARSPRQIPARVRDQVFLRDKQQCTYVGPNGKRCASTHVLQIDHITPVARGGASTANNLRLLCAYHNRLEAERLMGRRGPRAVT